MAPFLISELSEKQKPYSFRLLLQINYLGEEVCDLFLLASSILCLLGQFLRDAGNLYVGVPFDQETTITRKKKCKKAKWLSEEDLTNSCEKKRREKQGKRKDIPI